MNKTLQWLFLIILALALNVLVVPMAAFSLFGTQEGTSIFSLDYLIAFLVWFVPNIIVIQLIIATKKSLDRERFIGYLFIGVQMILLFTVYSFSVPFEAVVWIGGAMQVIVVALLVVTIRKRQPQLG